MRKIMVLLFTVFTMAVHAGQTENFKTDDGETLYYIRQGSGPRIILLTGGPGYGVASMKSWADSLGDEFESVLFDQRGTGLSKNVRIDSSTINLTRACRDLDKLREHFGDEALTLCGYSWGAMLALTYASVYPARVQNLVLVGPGPIDMSLWKAFQDNAERDTYPAERDSIAYWSRPEVVSRDPAHAGLMWTIFFLLNRFYDHAWGRSVCEKYFSHADYNPTMANLMWKVLYTSYDIKKPLKQYRGRCTIIRGRQDNIPEQAVYQIVQCIPQTKVYYIERCGHLADIEKPAELFRLVRICIKPVNQ